MIHWGLNLIQTVNIGNLLASSVYSLSNKIICVHVSSVNKDTKSLCHDFVRTKFWSNF
jgi:hypothetical protein